MAQPALVLDASVGVKWFSEIGESSVPQARAIMKAHAAGEIRLIVPDLFFHEISNTLVHKKSLSLALVEESLTTLFALELSVLTVNEQLLGLAVQLARKVNITEYDASYIAAAIENQCPLVTANPRHQKEGLGCQVIPIEKWKS
jgi:predicted nucleic acid-binding protein